MQMTLSNRDDIAIVYEIQKRLVELRDRFCKVSGNDLIIPPNLKADFIRYNMVFGRYKEGDFRHSESEKKSIRAIAQWTVDLNRSICGQTPLKLEWRD